jgi:glycine cleavage system H protein
MSQTPDNLKYTVSHEWILDNSDGTVTIGITDHAQSLLGDVVYVELPEVGLAVQKGKEFAVVESVKAASDIYAPVSGEVVEVNEMLDSAPETINSSPYEQGWIARIRLSNAADLDDTLDAQAYDASQGQ